MAFDARLLAGVGVMAAVVEAGGFAGAAESLGLTSSGVSRAVARLEARVGVRLFDRNPRAVTLTDEGRRFHAEVVPLLAGLEEAAIGAAGAAEAVGGRLRVSADPWFARMVLAPGLPRLLALHPALSLDLTVSNHREDMMGGGMDVAIRFGPPEPSSLIARKLADVRVLTCASPAYLERAGRPMAPQDVAGREALLFRDPYTGRPFDWEFQRGGEVVQVKVAGRLMTDDPSVAVAACAAGQGLFQAFELGIGPWLADGQLVQVLKDWAEERFPLYAYHPSRRLPPAKVRAFLDFVQRIAAEAGSSIL